jgi:hypothetical protein
MRGFKKKIKMIVKKGHQKKIKKKDLMKFILKRKN